MAALKSTPILSFKLLLAVYTAVMLLFVYSPITSMVFFSFNSGMSISVPFEGFSLRWYTDLFSDTAIIGALSYSLQLAVVNALVTTMLVTLISLVLRKEFHGKDLIFYILMLGVIMPGVILGLGAAIFYDFVGVSTSIWTALPVHVIWALPWGIFIMLIRFDPLLLSYEQAASSLGANNWKVFREITFPQIFPQIMATGLFAFTLSFGDLVRSIFIVGGTSTLPIYIFGYLS
ncbi:MAG: ABC transporter permease, partial [Candidatus Bathyarchaeia archaeon]